MIARWQIPALLLLMVPCLLRADGLPAESEELTIPAIRSLAAEAMLKNAHKLLERGKTSEAIVVLRDILERDDAGQVVQEGDLFLPARNVVIELLSQLKPGDLALYRRLIDRQAENAYSAYQRNGEIGALERILTQYPLSTVYNRALLTAARIALDRGRFFLARHLLQKVPVAGRDQAFQRLLLVSELRTGRTANAAAIAAELDDAGMQAMAESARADTDAETPPHFQPETDQLLTLWQEQMTPTLPSYAWLSGYRSEVGNVFGMKKHGRMFVDGLVIADDQCVHSFGPWITSFNPQTGARNWQRVENDYERTVGRLGFRELPFNSVPYYAGAILFEDAIGNDTTVCGRRYYTILNNLLTACEQPKRKKGNRLACLDLNTGDTFWAIGRSDAVPLATQRHIDKTIPENEHIIVDGDRSDWTKGPFLEFISDNKSARSFVCSSPEGIKMLIEVDDTTPVQRQLLRSDNVEVSISVEDPGLWDRFAVTVAVGNDGVRVRKKDERKTKKPPLQFKTIGKQADGGYFVELFIPWTNFGSSRVPDVGFRLHQVVHDYSAKTNQPKRSSIYLKNKGLPVHFFGDRPYIPMPGHAGVWTTNGTHFLAAPSLVGDRLMAPFAHNAFIGVVALSARTGALLWRRYYANLLLQNEVDLPKKAGMLIDDDTLYVLAGAGIVAAINHATGDLRWVSGYMPVAGKGNWQEIGQLPNSKLPLLPTVGWLENALLTTSDLLLLFPADRPSIIAVDRSNGRRRYVLPKEEFTYLIGQHQNKAYLAGRAELACLDMVNGKWLWRKPLGDSQGRGFLQGGTIVIPDRQSILMISAEDGAILRRLTVTGYGDHPITNLKPGQGGLFVFGAGTVARLTEGDSLASKSKRSLASALIDKAKGRYHDAAATLIALAMDGDHAPLERIVRELNEILPQVAEKHAALAEGVRTSPPLRDRLNLRLNCIDLFVRGKQFEAAAREAVKLATMDRYRLVPGKGDPQLRLSSRVLARRAFAELYAAQEEICLKALRQAVPAKPDVQDLLLLSKLRQPAAEAEALRLRAIQRLAARGIMTETVPAERAIASETIPVFRCLGMYQTESSAYAIAEDVVLDHKAGDIIGFDWAKGTRKWTFHAVDRSNEKYAAVAAYVLPRYIIVSHHWQYACVDRKTGSVLWRTELTEIGFATGHSRSTSRFGGRHVAGHKLRGKILVADTSGFVSIDLLTGEVEWFRDIGMASETGCDQSPMVYHCSERDGSHLVGVDADSGKELFDVHHPDWFPTTMSVQGDYCVESNEEKITATELSSGKRVFEHVLRPSGEKHPELVGRGPTLVLHDGEAFWLDKEKQSIYGTDLRSGDVKEYPFEQKGELNGMRLEQSYLGRYLIGFAYSAKNKSLWLLAFDMRERNLIGNHFIQARHTRYQTHLVYGTKLFLQAEVYPKDGKGECRLSFIDLISAEKETKLLALPEAPKLRNPREKRAHIRVFNYGSYTLQNAGNTIIIGRASQ